MNDRIAIDGNAIVYCQDAFNTPNGKTAHGLVRFTRRYNVMCVVDRCYAGKDAGEVLDGKPTGIPVTGDIVEALNATAQNPKKATHLVVGLAPDGGRLSPSAREDIVEAIQAGLNIDSGLHDFLSEDPEIMALARKKGVVIRDVRKPPAREDLHFFSGKIEEVHALKVAVLGTDSAVGKRTTAWRLVQALEDLGHRAEMIGTGQTAWMQGVRYGIIMDSLINDFVSGEIEHAVFQAWHQQQPRVIVLEGQGSLMNPAYPGGFELLAAGRPEIVVLQHAPARKEYDGFPGYRIQPLPQQIQVIEMLSGKPVVAIAVNHENLPADTIDWVCTNIEAIMGLPAFDVLENGAEDLARVVASYVKES